MSNKLRTGELAIDAEHTANTSDGTSLSFATLQQGNRTSINGTIGNASIEAT
jgi:hypothetical protein